jgi:hypothetical protein
MTAMKKAAIVLSAAALSILTLAGCFPASVPNRMGDTRGARIMNDPSADNYVSRPDIAERIMNTVPGVSSAVVLVKNQTAYVAVNEGNIRRNTYGANRNGGVDYNMKGAVTERKPDRDMTGTTPPPAAATLPADLRERVESTVRKADSSITTVYISNSPLLMSRFNTFSANRMGARTRSGVSELTEVIRRVFPAAR